MDPCTSLDGCEEEEETVAISHVGEGLVEIPAKLSAITNLEALCLHGNSIQRIEHLCELRRLGDLNLSSNCIQVIEGLHGLEQMTSLNLASNSLAAVGGLEGLQLLRRLNLSHNYITSLQGLSALHGGTLEVLDIRDNAITSLHEFSVLAGCPNLTELLVDGGMPGNPVCQQHKYRLAITAALPQLKRLDGRPVNPAEAMQYLAALHLHAFQPMQPPPSPLLLTDHITAVGGLVGVPSPLRCVEEAGASSMVSPEKLAAASQAPFRRIHNVLAAGGTHCSSRPPVIASSCQPGSSYLGPAHIQMSPAQVHQQPQLESTEALPAEADAEGQLARLFEACPQLVGPLIKALRCAQGDVYSLERPQHAALSPARPAGSETPPPAEAQHAEADSAEHAHSQPALASSPQPPPMPQCTSTGVQTKANGKSMEQLQAQVASLQDEVQALTAESEVQGQASAHMQKKAAVALQQAERQVLDIQQQTCMAVQQTKQELDISQERCRSLEALVTEYQGTQAASLQRQQDLEYELGRAWEELERVEGALQHQRAQHEVTMQQQEMQLAQTRQEAQQCAATLAEAISRQQALQLQLAEQQAVASRLQSERDAAEKTGSQRNEDLQQQLAAVQGQLQQQLQHLHEVQARESDAREQLKQLSGTLSSVHEEHEAAMTSVKRQHDQELRDIAADRLAAVSAALEERDAVQRQLATTEAEFRCALQEAAKESSEMRHDLEVLAADGVELRRALHEEHQKRKEAERMVMELTEVVQHQKLRMRGLAQEKADVAARLAAMNPQELERVRGELMTLRERAGELGAIRDQLVQERRLTESLQQRLAMAQQQLVDAREEAARKVAKAEATLRSAQEDAGTKCAAAEMLASEATVRAEHLAEEASRLRDVVKVKEAMLDSANERITELKNVAATAQAAAEEARLVAEEAEEELRAREGNDLDKHHNLRAEIEAQEQAIEHLEQKLGEAEGKLKDADKRASAAEQSAAEKESMINYVGEEVERVKGMFEQKEAHLAKERDAARKEAAQLKREQETLSGMVQQLETSIHDLSAQLQAEQATAASASQAAARHQAAAACSAARVSEVEEELREVLGVLEQHKAASAAKFHQLQSVLQDLQAPFLQLPL